MIPLEAYKNKLIKRVMAKKKDSYARIVKLQQRSRWSFFQRH